MNYVFSPLIILTSSVTFVEPFGPNNEACADITILVARDRAHPGLWYTLHAYGCWRGCVYRFGDGTTMFWVEPRR